MLTEQYCSFEVSKMLKEKGFDESTQLVWYEHLPSQNAVYNSEIGKPKRDYFYWEKEGEHNSPWTNNSPVPSYISGEVYSCPTHQMAMAWLRSKGIYMSIDTVISSSGNVYYSIDVYTEESGWEPVVDLYTSYEEAVEAACIYALNNLI